MQFSQVRKKRKPLKKGDHSSEEVLSGEIPLIDGTLDEISRALDKSEEILQKPTEKDAEIIIRKQVVSSHTTRRSCTC